MGAAKSDSLSMVTPGAMVAVRAARGCRVDVGEVERVERGNYLLVDWKSCDSTGGPARKNIGVTSDAAPSSEGVGAKGSSQQHCTFRVQDEHSHFLPVVTPVPGFDSGDDKVLDASCLHGLPVQSTTARDCEGDKSILHLQANDAVSPRHASALVLYLQETCHSSAINTHIDLALLPAGRNHDH